MSTMQGSGLPIDLSDLINSSIADNMLFVQQTAVMSVDKQHVCVGILATQHALGKDATVSPAQLC